jgi:3-oxoacyl-[acyl-carrier protein] reductase
MDGEPFMTIPIAQRNALVTGGTRGIGRAIVLALASAGANVVACYRRDIGAAEALATELKQTSGQHHMCQADVSRPEDVDRLVAQCRDLLGSVDVIVNAAGTISHVPFAELPLSEWQRVIDTNLTGTALVIQKTLPLMPDGGSIINVGSRVASVGIPLRAHYTAAKAGVVGLTRSLGKELGPRGIRVNVGAPGVIATEEAANLSAEQHARYRSLTALGRLGTPAEVADVVLFLASDLSRYVTGETVNVDGGI